MANTINMSYLLNYQNAGQLLNQKNNKQSTNSSTSTNTNNLVSQLAENNYNLNLSPEGLAALQNQENADSIDTGIFEGAQTDSTESKLSAKAQAYLEKLREQYGDDYDFIIADDVDDPQSLTANSTKKYSVILSSEELEKMADDEDYAQTMLGKIDDAVKTAENVIEQAGQNGVQLNNLTISFDAEGNTKLFATLEKLSESQQERLDAAKEKRAEEAEEAEDEKPLQMTIEADSEESFLEQLLNLEWSQAFAS